MRNAKRIKKQILFKHKISNKTFFGALKPLSMPVLLTQEDLFKAMNLLLTIVLIIIILNVWNIFQKKYRKVSLPIIEKESVIVKVKRLIVRVRNLNKYPKTSEKFITDIDSMKEIFDICFCK